MLRSRMLRGSRSYLICARLPGKNPRFVQPPRSMQPWEQRDSPVSSSSYPNRKWDGTDGIVALASQWKWDRKTCSGEGESASVCSPPVGMGLEWRSPVKRAIPVRVPDWPEEELPTTKQVEVYLMFWDQQRKQLAPDPGAGFLQKSYWLDPEDLEISAYQAKCFRAGRPDRALFIRRLIATYHKRRSSRPIPVARPAAPRPSPQKVSTGLAATIRQVSERVAAPPLVREAELSPAQVNEISRVQGLGICWQPGNVYRIGRTATAKSCLVLMDAHGRELVTYGSW